MFLVEPQTAYDARMGRAKSVTFAAGVPSPRQISRTAPLPVTTSPQSTCGAKLEICEGKLNDDFWTEWLLETLSFDGQPMLITRLVNSVVVWGNFSVRSEREMKKVELFRLIGKLIRMGRLERVARNYVTIPATDQRYRAYLASLAPPTVEFPKPNI
jgi:hypothetical protein